jgi:hypothetical protein
MKKRQERKEKKMEKQAEGKRKKKIQLSIIKNLSI